MVVEVSLAFSVSCSATFAFSVVPLQISSSKDSST